VSSSRAASMRFLSRTLTRIEVSSRELKAFMNAGSGTTA
jgi:hypothetical protein